VSVVGTITIRKRENAAETHGKRMCLLMTSSLTKSDCIAPPSTSMCGSQKAESVTPSLGQAVSVMGSSLAVR
jgi:hypothetical protein